MKKEEKKDALLNAKESVNPLAGLEEAKLAVSSQSLRVLGGDRVVEVVSVQRVAALQGAVEGFIHLVFLSVHPLQADHGMPQVLEADGEPVQGHLVRHDLTDMVVCHPFSVVGEQKGSAIISGGRLGSQEPGLKPFDLGEEPEQEAGHRRGEEAADAISPAFHALGFVVHREGHQGICVGDRESKEGATTTAKNEEEEEDDDENQRGKK